MASTASRQSKCMSAIIGTELAFTILERAVAASMSGTATLTISHPASVRDAIWWEVAETSLVSVLVMDWTTTGCVPPTGTLPT